ncbi:hypothetical protein EDB85DRAFT_2171119 [Lactarius pseudohatsudake]|nr:hypothetical protein EDB85DRAFT_2171119 [Lactarius pseudohatsudake]
MEKGRQAEKCVRAALLHWHGHGGLDIFGGFQLDLNSLFPDPAPACGYASSKRRGKEKESPLWDVERSSSSTRPCLGVVYGPASACPLLTSFGTITLYDQNTILIAIASRAKVTFGVPRCLGKSEFLLTSQQVLRRDFHSLRIYEDPYANVGSIAVVHGGSKETGLRLYDKHTRTTKPKNFRSPDKQLYGMMGSTRFVASPPSALEDFRLHRSSVTGLGKGLGAHDSNALQETLARLVRVTQPKPPLILKSADLVIINTSNSRRPQGAVIHESFLMLESGLRAHMGQPVIGSRCKSISTGDDHNPRGKEAGAPSGDRVSEILAWFLELTISKSGRENVQTQNQRALLDESEQLLQTVQIGREAMITLTQGSLRDPDGIQALEEAAAELYRALQATRDGVPNSAFGLSPQSTLLLGQSNGLSKSSGRRNLEIKGHKELRNYLDCYCELILYMREMDEVAYGKLCAVRLSPVTLTC